MDERATSSRASLLELLRSRAERFCPPAHALPRFGLSFGTLGKVAQREARRRETCIVQRFPSDGRRDGCAVLRSQRERRDGVLSGRVPPDVDVDPVAALLLVELGRELLRIPAREPVSHSARELTHLLDGCRTVQRHPDVKTARSARHDERPEAELVEKIAQPACRLLYEAEVFGRR